MTINWQSFCPQYQANDSITYIAYHVSTKDSTPSTASTKYEAKDKKAQKWG